MSDRIIFLDQDGVVSYANLKILRLVNEKFGTDYSVSDIRAFDYQPLPREHAEFAMKQWELNDLYKNVDWIPGAKEGVEKLQTMGRVVIVSSPFPEHATSKMKWLMDRGFDREDIILTADKALLDGKGDLIIDDLPFFVEGMSETPVILFDRPYNQDSDIEPRVHNWDELLKTAKEILFS